MQYDLSSDFQRKAFSARVDNLMEKGCVVELTEKTFRTRNQNSYLHLLIGVVAMECGVGLDYAKEEYFKRLCNRDLFEIVTSDKFVGVTNRLRSSADLTKEEMSIAIDRFKRWGNENGMYMPSPEDTHLLREIEIEMGRMRAYL